MIGSVSQFNENVNEILFAVYTERVRIEENELKTDVTQLISARMATEFERGIYYGMTTRPAAVEIRKKEKPPMTAA